MSKNGGYKYGWQDRCNSYSWAVLTLTHVDIHKIVQKLHQISIQMQSCSAVTEAADTLF